MRHPTPGHFTFLTSLVEQRRLGRVRYFNMASGLFFSVGIFCYIYLTFIFPYIGVHWGLTINLISIFLPMLLILASMFFFVWITLQRLQDADLRMGMNWFFLMVIAFLFIFIIALAMPGSKEANNYGPPPAAPQQWERKLFYILAILLLLTPFILLHSLVNFIG